MDYCASIRNTEHIKDAPNYKFVQGDITSADLVNFVLNERDIDTIVHFAAQSHVGEYNSQLATFGLISYLVLSDNSFGNALSFTHNNIFGTQVLLESACAHKIKRFIHISTDEVYGEVTSESDDLAEGCVLAPTNPYAASKAGAEMMVNAYHRSFGLPVIITRSNNVYGPLQYPEKVIPKFILLLEQGMKW